MDIAIINLLKNQIISVWPDINDIPRGIVGPDSNIIKNIEQYQSVNVFGEPIIELPTLGQLTGSNQNPIKKSYTGTIWEKLTTNAFEYFINTKAQNTKASKEEIVSWMVDQLGINAVFARILYDAFDNNSIIVTNQGILNVNNDQYTGFISDFEISLKEMDRTSLPTQDITSRLLQFSKSKQFAFAVVEAVYYESIMTISPKYVSKSRVYMKDFIMNPSWHKTFTKDNPVDMWGREIISGKLTIIKVIFTNVSQYVKLMLPSLYTPTLMSILTSAAEELIRQFQGKSEYWQPIGWQEVLELAMYIIDRDEDLVRHLSEMFDNLSQSKSSLIK